MKISLNSLLVNDQEKALDFYTTRLGFVKKNDIPMGEFRWLTVVSHEDMDGTELVLEPNQFPPAATYQKALLEAGIAATAFEVASVETEYRRLSGAGVVFQSEPVDAGGTKIAVFHDTCGNLIQIYQLPDQQ